jgi:hypothetical protein
MDYLRQEGRSFDGVLAIAGGRPFPDRGAGRYNLTWPLHGKEVLLCERREANGIPYEFHDYAWMEVGYWIKSLEQQKGKPDILIIDELGRLEAGGGGFVKFWDRILKLNPVMLVCSVRAETREELESRLGQRFDLVIDATEPGAREKLNRLSSSASDWQRAGRYGAASGAIEVSLGSMLHATKIPFRGLPLAVIQAVILFFAGSRLARPWMVIWVSYVSAALKALSPAGNRIRPMLAIAVQGSLFGLSVRLLGWNTAGITAGAWLVGAWAALQGFVFQYLLLGNALFEAYGEVQIWIDRHLNIAIVSLPVLVAFYVAFLGCISATVVGYFQWRKRPPAILARALRDTGGGMRSDQRQSRSWAGRLFREYRQKAFWVPLVIVFAVLLLSGSPAADLAALPLRAIGIVAALFVVFSLMKPEKWTAILQRTGFWGPAITLGRITGNYASAGSDDSRGSDR